MASEKPRMWNEVFDEEIVNITLRRTVPEPVPVKGDLVGLAAMWALHDRLGFRCAIAQRKRGFDVVVRPVFAFTFGHGEKLAPSAQ